MRLRGTPIAVAVFGLLTPATLLGGGALVAAPARAEHCPPGGQVYHNPDPFNPGEVCLFSDGHTERVIPDVGPQAGSQGQQPQTPPPVTNAITLAFSPPNIGSIVATVSNSSDLNAVCHYSSQPIDSPRDFNVPAHGSTPLTFTGINAGINYTAIVTCSDASGKQTVPLGTATQNVRF